MANNKLTVSLSPHDYGKDSVKKIKIAKKIADMLNTSYYHTSYSDDLNGVEVCAAIKNIFSMAVGAAKGLCSTNASDDIKVEAIWWRWRLEMTHDFGKDERKKSSLSSGGAPLIDMTPDM